MCDSNQLSEFPDTIYLHREYRDYMVPGILSVFVKKATCQIVHSVEVVVVVIFFSFIQLMRFFPTIIFITDETTLGCFRFTLKQNPNYADLCVTITESGRCSVLNIFVSYLRVSRRISDKEQVWH